MGWMWINKWNLKQTIYDFSHWTFESTHWTLERDPTGDCRCHPSRGIEISVKRLRSQSSIEKKNEVVERESENDSICMLFSTQLCTSYRHSRSFKQRIHHMQCAVVCTMQKNRTMRKMRSSNCTECENVATNHIPCSQKHGKQFYIQTKDLNRNLAAAAAICLAAVLVKIIWRTGQFVRITRSVCVCTVFGWHRQSWSVLCSVLGHWLRWRCMQIDNV